MLGRLPGSPAVPPADSRRHVTQIVRSRCAGTSQLAPAILSNGVARTGMAVVLVDLRCRPDQLVDLFPIDDSGENRESVSVERLPKLRLHSCLQGHLLLPQRFDGVHPRGSARWNPGG